MTTPEPCTDCDTRHPLPAVRNGLCAGHYDEAHDWFDAEEAP